MDDKFWTTKEFWTGVFVTAGCLFFAAGFGVILWDVPVGAALLLLSAAWFTGALLVNDFYLTGK
jgi:hypothetical protein